MSFFGKLFTKAFPKAHRLLDFYELDQRKQDLAKFSTWELDFAMLADGRYYIPENEPVVRYGENQLLNIIGAKKVSVGAPYLTKIRPVNE